MAAPVGLALMVVPVAAGPEALARLEAREALVRPEAREAPEAPEALVRPEAPEAQAGAVVSVAASLSPRR